jgi:peptidyl-prolyl cis-trans isomerase C
MLSRINQSLSLHAQPPAFRIYAPHPQQSTLNVDHGIITIPSSQRSSTMSSSSLTMPRCIQAVILLTWFLVASMVESTEDEDVNVDPKEAMRQAREDAKPWLMTDTVIFGKKIPISPATILTIGVGFVNLVYQLTKKSWAQANHILIPDHTAATKKMMTEMKKDIGSDLDKFGAYAKKYSTCPSKAKHGDLGKFKPGDMAPPFDKAVFDPNSKVGTAIGPIETTFGHHLIYIRARQVA